MSPRPARATQTEIQRAMRAAEQAGEGWAVEILVDGTIRLARGPARVLKDDDEETPRRRRIVL